MTVLQLNGVSLTYPQSRLEKKKKMIPSKIGPVDLEFYDSEIVGIIGRNGSGKSTLLRIMGGGFSLLTKVKLESPERFLFWQELGSGLIRT